MQHYHTFIPYAEKYNVMNDAEEGFWIHHYDFTGSPDSKTASTGHSTLVSPPNSPTVRVADSGASNNSTVAGGGTIIAPPNPTGGGGTVTNSPTGGSGVGTPTPALITPTYSPPVANTNQGTRTTTVVPVQVFSAVPIPFIYQQTVPFPMVGSNLRQSPTDFGGGGFGGGGFGGGGGQEDGAEEAAIDEFETVQDAGILGQLEKKILEIPDWVLFGAMAVLTIAFLATNKRKEQKNV